LEIYLVEKMAVWWADGRADWMATYSVATKAGLLAAAKAEKRADAMVALMADWTVAK